MDFSQIKLFGNKKFSDLLKEIHVNQKDKEAQLRSLIEGLKPLITSPGEATMIVPLIKEYLDVSVKNDEQLVKIATIVQRLVSSQAKTGGSDHEMISEDEKKQLLSELENVAFDVQDKIDSLESRSDKESTNV